ncbi:MAG: hypothetical protein LBI19_09320 [Oscillospiraceae bacterium]|jgi:hypothetical protein|nr:hypothetical protein [Oscillospiraceae bacterium]
MMKKRIAVIVAAVLIALGAGAFVYIQADSKQEREDSVGLFSWQRDVFEDGGAGLLSFMKRHGFTELYQWFSSELDNEEIRAFLRAAQQEGINIFLLTGDPAWAKDPAAERLLGQIDRVVGLNASLGDGAAGIKGLIFDVEPQALDEWGDETKWGALMDSFTAGMKAAYAAAAFQELEVIVCVPNYYDDIGFSGELHALIRTSCDRVAVMNYTRGQEAAHVETEAGYAQRYGKDVINVYEFNPPGHYGLMEWNTYYNEGLSAAVMNFMELREAYPDTAIDMAAHDYEILRELLG